MQTERVSDRDRLVEYITATGMTPGTVYSQEAIAAALGKGFDRSRGVIYAVNRVLEKEHNRTLQCVSGRGGYRIAAPRETAAIVDTRLDRANQQLKKGEHTVTHTDVTQLSQQEKQQLDLALSGMRSLRRELTAVKRRLVGVEEQVSALQATALSEDELVYLRTLVSRAEAEAV